MSDMKDRADQGHAGTSCAEHVRRYAEYLAGLLRRLDTAAVEKIATVLEEARRDGRTIYFVGNGGSAATASHFATDFAQGAGAPEEAPFRALSLTDNLAALTALGNDVGYDQVFVGQLRSLFRPGDVLVAISASGNSENVLRAVEFANARAGVTVGLVGFDGGRLKRLCNACLHVETAAGEYEVVEDIHHAACHVIAKFVKQRLAQPAPARHAAVAAQR